MIKYQKYSIPGNRKITHGKLSDHPHLKVVTMEEAEKLGIPVRREFIISFNGKNSEIVKTNQRRIVDEQNNVSEPL